MKICMPRGDIRDVRFTVYDHTGQRICTVPFDEIYVTFKNNTNTAVCLFQKRLTAGTVWQEEGAYAQFEYFDENLQQSRRVWVPVGALQFGNG